MGFENEAEQSKWRPCRQIDGRSKRTNELTSSIVPRGTSFHRSVELGFSPIVVVSERFSCCCGFPGPAELGAIDPYAVVCAENLIRVDDEVTDPLKLAERRRPSRFSGGFSGGGKFGHWRFSCLLYTSDAADEEDSVDLGGRRIINK